MLLRATSNLETTRIQIYKDVMSSLLGGLKTRGQASAQAQQRLLSVLHGQLMGMEGRLKEERGARMAALAGRCNLETREEMEAEHCREAAEKAQAELLCEHADQQVIVISNLFIYLHCFASVLEIARAGGILFVCLYIRSATQFVTLPTSKSCELICQECVE